MDSSPQRPPRITPTAGVAGVKPYSVPKHGAPIDLKLDANEGEAPPEELFRQLAAAGPEVMRRYPDAYAVQRLLARHVGVEADRVIVTAGGDDALDRLCRSVLMPGRELITTDPGFEMLPRYAKLAGATVKEVLWPRGPFPVEEVIAQITPETTVIAFVSPNNPTGVVGTAEDLRRLSAAAPDAIILADLAYIEFADEDLTPVALSLPNCVMIRTLSKAWGLAGLRVGYAVGPAEIIGWMRAAGGPYAVARPSLALAAARLEMDAGETERFIAQVRDDRARLEQLFQSLDIPTTDSQGNFVFALLDDPLWLRDALAGLGIAIRAYPGHPRLGNALRVTCPGNRQEADRLLQAISAAMRPQALLIGVEGVVTDGKASPVPASRLTELRKLSESIPLIAVTTRSADEAPAYLEALGLAGHFRAVVSAEDPADAAIPMKAALKHLEFTNAWFLGAIPGQLSAARSCGIVPLGMIPQGESAQQHSLALTQHGAARIIETFDDVIHLFPKPG